MSFWNDACEAAVSRTRQHKIIASNTSSAVVVSITRPVLRIIFDAFSLAGLCILCMWNSSRDNVVALQARFTCCIPPRFDGMVGVRDVRWHHMLGLLSRFF
jgi:hypothetical protein